MSGLALVRNVFLDIGLSYKCRPQNFLCIHALWKWLESAPSFIHSTLFREKSSSYSGKIPRICPQRFIMQLLRISRRFLSSHSKVHTFFTKWNHQLISTKIAGLEVFQHPWLMASLFNVNVILLFFSQKRLLAVRLLLLLRVVFSSISFRGWNMSRVGCQELDLNDSESK